MEILKAKMYQMTSKIERCKINAQSSKKFMNYVPILSFVFFRTFQFLRSFGTFWPLKSPFMDYPLKIAS